MMGLFGRDHGRGWTFARNVGLFVGHVRRGFTEPVGSGSEQGRSVAGDGERGEWVEVDRRVEESSAEANGEQVRLRRTVIDEVSIEGRG